MSLRDCACHAGPRVVCLGPVRLDELIGATELREPESKQHDRGAELGLFRILEELPQLRQVFRRGPRVAGPPQAEHTEAECRNDLLSVANGIGLSSPTVDVLDRAPRTTAPQPRRPPI